MSSHHKLESLVSAYGDAVQKGDAEAVARLFTEDAIVLPPNRLEIRGRQAIQDFYREIMGGGWNVRYRRHDRQMAEGPPALQRWSFADPQVVLELN